MVSGEPLSAPAILAEEVLGSARRGLGTGGRGACFAAVRGAKVVGLINIAIGEPWLSEGGQHATCFAWLIAPALRGSFLGSRVALRLLETPKRWLADLTSRSALYISAERSMPEVFHKEFGSLLGTEFVLK